MKKQIRLNELDVIVTLHKEQLVLSQDHYEDENGGYLAHASSADEDSLSLSGDTLLIFPDAKWKILQTRTEELKAERTEHKNKFK